MSELKVAGVEPFEAYGQKYLLGYATCCRTWPVLLLTRMGRCGSCGEYPTSAPVGKTPLKPLEGQRVSSERSESS